MKRFELSALALFFTLAPAAFGQAPDAAAEVQAAPPSPLPADLATPGPSLPPPAAEPAASAPAAPPVASAPAAAEENPELAPFPEASAQPPARPRPRAFGHAEARGTEPESESAVDVSAPRLPVAPIPRLYAWLGLGMLWVTDEGLDPFYEENTLVLVDLGAALSVATAGDVDIAAVAAWDNVAGEARYRGEATAIHFARLALGPEARWSIVDRVFLFGRVSPTLTRLSAELDESSSGATLSHAEWLWGAEGAVGLDLRFAEARPSLPVALGFHLRLDAGYAWADTGRLTLQAEGSDAPVRTAALDLGELAPGGPFFKASIGFGF